MKKVFSLNLISYLKSKGHIENQIDLDEETGNVFYVFDESSEVAAAIREYKKSDATVNLHDFIANFKSIKRDIYDYVRG